MEGGIATSLRDYERYRESFTSSIKTCELILLCNSEHPGPFSPEEIKEFEDELAAMQDALKTLNTWEATRALLSEQHPKAFKVGTKLRIKRNVRVGEEPLKVGQHGTYARLDSYSKSQIPENCIPVRFKGKPLGFADLPSLVLFVPNFCVEPF